MIAKKKKVLLIIAILLILATVVVAMFQFTQFGYLLTVPYRSAFTEIASHVYINSNYAGDRQELLEMIEQAKDRVRTFFGDVLFQDETTFIICDDEKLTRKLGEDHATVIFSFPTEVHYICISDEYLELDILAHEITHAELHTRLSAEAQKRIPTWFDEGIALQNDYRERYSEAQWVAQTDNRTLFIDASNEFVKVTNNSKLTDENITRIVDEFASRNDVAHFARCVSYDEIKGQDYNLSVSSYVEQEDTREVIDIAKLNAELEEIVAREQVLRDEIAKIIAELEG